MAEIDHLLRQPRQHELGVGGGVAGGEDRLQIAVGPRPIEQLARRGDSRAAGSEAVGELGMAPPDLGEPGIAHQVLGERQIAVDAGEILGRLADRRVEDALLA